MKELTKSEQLAKKLLYTPEYPADHNADLKEKAFAFCEGYKQFLDNGKTERDAAALAEKMLLEAGYRVFDDTAAYQPGDKVYVNYHGKSIIAATIGTNSLEAGVHLNIAHIDCPRLDLKPNPLYEQDHYALFKTHYYGGVRKYQWPALPLALHGVICKTNGEVINVCVGEKDDDPVFYISDLLPHLSREQNSRTLSDGVRAEELNIIVGSLAIEDAEVKNAVKLNTLLLLNQMYGITEKDFLSAELEIVPALKARDVGFDRAMVGGYGQDDRSDAYPALMAEITAKQPSFTSICVLCDKEEIGSEGLTGMQSMYVFHFLEQLCACQNASYIRTCQHSKCLSSDVTAAYDPTWASAFEASNSTYCGRGVGISKYTGAGGKSSTNDANAELVAYMTGIFDQAGVAWQIGELGRTDLGGGGTIAKFVSRHGIDTIDIGVPVLSMHSPFELTSKIDVYMAYLAFKAFNEANH